MLCDVDTEPGSLEGIVKTSGGLQMVLRAFVTVAIGGLGNLLVVGVDDYCNLASCELVWIHEERGLTRHSDDLLPVPVRKSMRSL